MASVLIVDDNAVNVEILEDIMGIGGHSAATASSALEGLRKLQELRPDLIILDLHMPGMNGFDFLETLADVCPDAAHIPILIVTGDTSARSAPQLRRDNIVGVIFKPIDINQVMTQVSELIA